MNLSLRRLKLEHRMVVVLGLVALLQTTFLGLFALFYLNNVLDEQMGQRALHVAKTVAVLPSVVLAVEQKDSELLGPLSLLVAEKTEARFVVIGDRLGNRLAHPNPDLIGHSMVDDDGDDISPTVVFGESTITKAEGSLGWSMRARAPIYNVVGEEIIGVVSVGYQLDKVAALIAGYRNTLVLVILAAFGLSVLTAIWFAKHFKKAIFGLEPEEIGRLYGERNATLESVREGIVAIDAASRITTINRTAVETLGLGSRSDLIGKPIHAVFPDSNVQDVLATGMPQFDQEIWLHNRNLVVNRLPLKQGDRVIGVVSSFRLKDELDLVSRKLTRIRQYADSLRSQSHEYSNKLHTIAGLIQLGAKDEALALITQETQSHQTLIQLLLKSAPDPILAGCLLGKFNRARELGLKLDIDPESHMTELPDTLPRDQLASILGNLLDNAFEATLSHRGSGGEVRLTMTDVGRELIFEIEDQGPGIPAEAQERIFEKGVSSKADEGHGLGLHLVKSLLDHLNGWLMVEPGDDHGSRFTVYIPKTASVAETVTGTS